VDNPTSQEPVNGTPNTNGTGKLIIIGMDTAEWRCRNSQEANCTIEKVEVNMEH